MSLRGVLRPPLRPKTSTGNLAACAASARAERLPDWAERPICWFLLAFTPCPTVMATASGVALLVGCARYSRLPLCRASFAKACASSLHFGATHWVWTTHPAPASGLAYGCTRVAANSGAPGLHPPPRTATAGAIAATGATASNTLAVQGVGLLVASGRLPPASGCTCWGRFARGVHAGRLYPNRCGAAVGSPSTSPPWGGEFRAYGLACPGLRPVVGFVCVFV